MPTARFAKEIKRAGRNLENATTHMIRQIAKRTLQDVVWLTEVDTGQARSNWRVGVNRVTAVIPPYHPYPKGSKGDGEGRAETANANAAIRVGFDKINMTKGLRGLGFKSGLVLSNPINIFHKENALGGRDPATFETRVHDNVTRELAKWRPFAKQRKTLGV